ncbi:hypothetical protein AXX17_AT1G36420 [Arabidopsis thaliana]|uniref:Uncharacterized protein n=1 Tax=Arabidopsis thaliana TaxID=3702 RepID=A0A178WKS0_ARATH|nr:hypothetical protein AXX17_AT1G36420 [Arabidopsis thaliana]
MVFDAVEGAKRRRQDLAFLFFLLRFHFISPMSPLLPASFSPLQTLFQPFQTLARLSFHSGDNKTSDGGRQWGPAFALPLHHLFTTPPIYSNEALLKNPIIIAKPFVSRSDLLIPKEHSQRTSLMAGELTLGPSDAPCPVETSTPHGGSIFWVASHWSSPRFTLSTYPVMASISDHSPPVMLNRVSELPIIPLKRRQQASDKTLILKLGYSFVLGPLSAGSLLFPPQPTKCCKFWTLKLTWPSSVLFLILSNPTLLCFNFAEIGYGRLPHSVLSPIVRLDKPHLLILVDETSSVLELFP